MCGGFLSRSLNGVERTAQGVVTVHPIIAAQIVNEMSERREARAVRVRAARGSSVFGIVRAWVGGRRADPPRGGARHVQVAGR
jgi:hypothetical protein